MQGILRDIFGWKTSQDYWFPNIRSMGGAILVMSSVLYPYIYLLTRASFLTTPISFFQTSSIYGRNTFFYVALPLARPAIVAGLALVLMETVNDFGVADFFGLQTLSVGVFHYIAILNDLPLAFLLALIIILVMVLLYFFEIGIQYVSYRI